MGRGGGRGRGCKDGRRVGGGGGVEVEARGGRKQLVVLMFTTPSS